MKENNGNHVENSDEKMIADFFNKLEFSELFEDAFDEKGSQEAGTKTPLKNQ